MIRERIRDLCGHATTKTTEIYVKERAWALAVAANQLQIGIAR